MKLIEVQRTGRPIPRYFPPGYFDRSFWLMFGLNVFGVLFCGGFSFWHAVEGNEIGLAFQVIALTLNLWSTTRMLRMMHRHSKEWRTVDRPRFVEAVEEAHAECEKMAREFAQFMAQRNGSSEHEQTAGDDRVDVK